jgi:hypothetical protein
MRFRSSTAAAVDARLRIPLAIAALLVIPDLILEEQPLHETWHTVAVVANWAIWLAFLAEFLAIVLLASDWRAWMRRYPLALPMLILTPPFAPGAIQALRAFRLLRLLRVARGFQFVSKELLSLEGVRYVAAVAVFSRRSRRQRPVTSRAGTESGGRSASSRRTAKARTSTRTRAGRSRSC